MKLREYVSVIETRPTPEVVEAAHAAAMQAADAFTSVDEIMDTAHVLAKIYLAKGDLTGFGCTLPFRCVKANLVYGWLHREHNDRFGIGQELITGVVSELSTWVEGSGCCVCSVSHSARKKAISEATIINHQRSIELQLEQESIFGENILAASQGGD